MSTLTEVDLELLKQGSGLHEQKLQDLKHVLLSIPDRLMDSIVEMEASLDSYQKNSSFCISMMTWYDQWKPMEV